MLQMLAKRRLADAVWAQQSYGAIYFVLWRLERVEMCIWFIKHFPIKSAPIFWPVHSKSECHISQSFSYIKVKILKAVHLDVIHNIFSDLFFQRTNFLNFLFF